MAISYEEDMKRRERDAQLQKQNQQVSGTDAARIIGGATAAGIYPSLNLVAQSNGAMATAANTAAKGIRGLGRLGAVAAGFNGALDGFNTPTEQYRDRFGLQTDNPSFAGDLGVRTLGVFSDVGDNLLLGAPSKIASGLGIGFLDKNMSKWNQPKSATPQANTATTRQNVTTVNNPFNQPSAQTSQNYMQSVNQALGNLSGYGMAETPVNPATPQAIAQSQKPVYNDATTSTINGKAIDARDGIAPKPMYDIAQERALQQTYSEVNTPSTRMPAREARGYLADIERKNLIDAIKRPAGKSSIMDGLTANQQKMLAEIAMQGDNLDMEAYKQKMGYAQANMAQQNENARATLQQQNAMTKALLDETGQNTRSQAQLGLDLNKLNQEAASDQAKLGLDREKLAMEKQKANTDNFAQNQLIALQDQYNKATNDADREAIKQRAQEVTALLGKGGNGKDRYMAIKGGDAIDAAGNVLTQPDRILDTQTGRFMEQGQSSQSAQPTMQAGAVVDGYRFKGGDPADQKNWEKL